MWFNDKANGFKGSSELWEPGSAMVPTFCVSVDVLNLRSLSHILADGRDKVVGNRGDGGGDPKRESWSSSCSMPNTM